MTVLFQVYVNSYFALLNAPYYLQPSEPDAVNISTFHAHRPSLHTRESEAEEVQESRKDVVKHSYGQDNEVYPARPVQVVMVSSCIIVDRSRTNRHVLTTAADCNE